VGTGAARGSLGAAPPSHRQIVWLIGWGFAQQGLLQTMFLREAQAVTSRGAGIALAAALFGVLHLPNPLLTVVTVTAALGWCAIYDRHPNVLPLALSHAAGTLILVWAPGDAAAGRLHVGAAYLRLVS
jgi:membrane protease YdiL (CAAX protease family)